MKRLGTLLMYVPLVWYIGWIFIMYIFEFTNMDVNILAYLLAVWYVTIYPPTWFVIALGLVGYFLQRKK